MQAGISVKIGNPLLVDNFAGGGGASFAIEQVFARPIDIAVNHDPEAVAMHTANHPFTQHYCQDVFSVDPVKATNGQPVALAWFSPDCKHFSKAKGGKPRSNKIRDLAWVVIRWAKLVRPQVIALENVEEFRDWGPLLDDGRPCPDRKGSTFQVWRSKLEELGYEVDCQLLRACDYGAPTIRRRLFLIARRDGLPIVWPEPTHGDPNSEAVKKGRLQPWRTAAECLDWSLDCPSIFARQRPLVDATLRRIAKGLRKYVIEADAPFIINDKPGSNKHLGLNLIRQFGNSVAASIDTPIGTITAGGGGKTSVVVTHLVKLRGTCRDGQRVDQPAPTITAGGTHIGEIRTRLQKRAACLCKYYGVDVPPDLNNPLGTITTKDRFSCVQASLGSSPLTEEDRYSAWWIARLVEDYGHPAKKKVIFPWFQALSRPAFLTTKAGDILVDIGFRMLQPRELFTLQGFPDTYKIDLVVNGRPLTKAAQVRMCGNSVSPPPAMALLRANLAEMLQNIAAA